MKKFNEELVQQVRDGKLAIKNEGCSVEELQDLLSYCFPKYTLNNGLFKYYFKSSIDIGSPAHSDNILGIPSLPVSDFYIKEKDIFTLAKEKGFELIMEDMWCWDDEINNAQFDFIFAKLNNTVIHPYQGLIGFYQNASKEDPSKPKEEVLEIGKLAYFWDEENPDSCHYAKYGGIQRCKYVSTSKSGISWKFCSHKNPFENGKES